MLPFRLVDLSTIATRARVFPRRLPRFFDRPWPPAVWAASIPLASVHSLARRVHRHLRPQAERPLPAPAMDAFFVKALVTASLCRNHSSLSSPSSPSKDRCSGEWPAGSLSTQIARVWPQRCYSTNPSKRDKRPKIPPLEHYYKASLLYIGSVPQDDREKGYILFTPLSEGDGRLKAIESPVPLKPPEPMIIGPDAINFVHKRLFSDDPSIQHVVEEINYAVSADTAQDYSHTEIWDLYKKLPLPRLRYLSRRTVFLLVSRMMTVPLRDQEGMLRYLSIIGDMKTTGIPITRNEWNAAMSFVGLCYGKVTEAEVKAVLLLWQESEEVYKIPADPITFNILLIVAIKAMQHRLVKLILEEIKRRELRLPDRFTYTALITYFGIQRDPTSVREVYTEMVDNNEVIDIAVLNSLMVAFLRAWERAYAERIYYRLVGVALERPVSKQRRGNPNKDIYEYRRMRRRAREMTVRSVMKQYAMDRKVDLTPDVATFGTFIGYYCRTGSWDNLVRVLRDRQALGLEPDNSVYLWLLRGFVWWGLGTSPAPRARWTRQNFTAVYDDIVGGRWGLTMDKSMSKWLLRATAKMYNSREKLQDTWRWIERQWAARGEPLPGFLVRDYHRLCSRNLWDGY